jgi:hypothetical protein
VERKKKNRRKPTAVVLVACVTAVGHVVATEMSPDTRTVVALEFVRATIRR